MSPADMLRALESVARRLGIPVRSEPFCTEGRGGLCRVHGETVIVVNASLPVAERVAVLADALAAFDLEGIYVTPVLRAKMAQLRDQLRTRRRPPSRPGA